MSIVICGFPGVGKSTASVQTTPIVRFLDSDSSSFPRDNFPDNYLQHIENILDDRECNIIFTSTHKEVLTGLSEKKIPHVVVFPDVRLKMEYIARYASRGSSESFIRLLMDKWHDFLGDIANHLENCPYARGIVLGSEQYLSDVILAASLCACACK